MIVSWPGVSQVKPTGSKEWWIGWERSCWYLFCSCAWCLRLCLPTPTIARKHQEGPCIKSVITTISLILIGCDALKEHQSIWGLCMSTGWCPLLKWCSSMTSACHTNETLVRMGSIHEPSWYFLTSPWSTTMPLLAIVHTHGHFGDNVSPV